MLNISYRQRVINTHTNVVNRLFASVDLCGFNKKFERKRRLGRHRI